MVDDGSSIVLFVVLVFFCDPSNWFVICWISVRIDVVSGSSLPDARSNVSCNSRKRLKSVPPSDFYENQNQTFNKNNNNLSYLVVEFFSWYYWKSKYKFYLFKKKNNSRYSHFSKNSSVLSIDWCASKSSLIKFGGKIAFFSHKFKTREILFYEKKKLINSSRTTTKFFTLSSDGHFSTWCNVLRMFLANLNP